MRELFLNDSVKETIRRINTEHSFQKEIGGILVGAYDTEHKCINLTDMSFPFSGDSQSKFRFFRKSNGHQEFMDQLWENSGHTKAYIGEWHTHDQDTPSPSMIDRMTWKRISKRNNNFDDCYFMIIGRKEFIIWTVVDKDFIEVYRGDMDAK